VRGGPPPQPYANYFTGGRIDEITALQEPMGEDCLRVNVVTPAADRRRRPVLFYIHGGGFTTGTGLTMTLGDRFVAREDVVLVTVNHRLGALGYMYLGGLSPEFAQGNPGMLDLVAALEWVRDNIAAFGGDPEKVTIFGESGGAMKVSFLLSMPQARGLFRGAIMQSGLMPEPATPESATATTTAFMERVGARTLDELQALPYDRLVGSGTPGTRPVGDGRTLALQPWAQAPASAADVPVIIGYCKDELTLFAIGDQALFQLQWQDVPSRLTTQVGLPAEAAARVVDTYRAAFPHDNPSDAYFRISSDASFGRAMVDMADKKAAQRPPVYFYRMEYDTQLPPGLRALHTAELPMTVDLAWQPEAAQLSRQISSAWAAFARTGDPNHAGLPNWGRYDQTDRACMIFDITSCFGPDPQQEPRASLYAAMAGVAHWNPL
jgi:para-nitrobenzyl esterase